MIHVPEQWLEGVLLRADFRAFYAMERDFGRPLATILGDALQDGLTALYRITWCLTASERPRGLTFDDFLDLLPEPGALGALVFGMIDEAITPVCPVHEAVPTDKPPAFVRWSQLAFEGRHLLVQSEAEWWRSTFRTQQALLWELSRYHDPEGKHGRPMSAEEIEAVNNRNIAMLMGAPFTDGNQTHRRA